MRFGAPLKPKPNAAVLVAKCRPHSHSTQDIRVGGTLRTSPGARLRAPRTPARTRTFSPLDVVPAVQDLLQQGHQSEGADEDEKQSSVPQQIPVRRGIRVAHPGGRSCAAGRGGRGAPSGPRNHARGSGAPGLRGPAGRTIYQVPLGVIRRMGTSRGKVSDGAASAEGIRASPAPGRSAGQGWRQELGGGSRSYLPMALPPGASARHPPISLRRGNGQVPQTRGSPSRRGGGQWGAGPGPPSASAPKSVAHRPLRWHSGSWLPSAVPCPRGPSDPPGPQRGSAKVGLQFCIWEVGDKTPGQSG